MTMQGKRFSWKSSPGTLLPGFNAETTDLSREQAFSDFQEGVIAENITHTSPISVAYILDNNIALFLMMSTRSHMK